MATSRSLGTLTLDLIAKISGFVDGMTSAERAAARSQKKIADDAKQRAKETESAWKNATSSVSNLIGGALMLAAACRLVVQTGRAGAVGDARLRVLAVVAALALLAQLVLGGLVSASFAGLSCTGVADCVQQARTAQWPWPALDPWREPHFATSASVPVHPVGALAQLVHRAGAVLVVPLLLALGWRALGGPCHRTGVVLLGALVLQLVIGVSMVALALPLPLALAHNLVALLLLVLVVRLI